LGKAGAGLWGSIHRDYVIEDSTGHQMLLRICEARDSLASYDKQIGRDGLTIRMASGLKEHPLLKVQLATRSPEKPAPIPLGRTCGKLACGEAAWRAIPQAVMRGPSGQSARR
jgi:hypothetical protein